MSQKVLEQIKKLSNLEYTLDNGSIDLDQYFSEITFKKRNADKQAVDSIRVVFEDYIIKPFDGFDLHEKWNNGIAPYSKIIKSTFKLELFKNLAMPIGVLKLCGDARTLYCVFSIS